MPETVTEETLAGGFHSLPDHTFIVIEGSVVIATLQADCVECAEMERTKKWPRAQLGALFGPPYPHQIYGMCMHQRRFNDIANQGINPCSKCMGKGTLDA